MMTQRQRILAIIGALALLGATLSPGLGHGDGYSDSASVTVLPGPLMANLTWVSPDETCDGMAVNSLDGCLIVRVLDERGNVKGWNVSLSTRDYSGPNGHLGADQLVLSPGSVSLVRGNPDLASHSTFAVDPMRTSPARIWSVPVNSGDGEYDLPLAGTLTTPGEHQSNHTYTVIVNIDGIAP